MASNTIGDLMNSMLVNIIFELCHNTDSIGVGFNGGICSGYVRTGRCANVSSIVFNIHRKCDLFKHSSQ